MSYAVVSPPTPSRGSQATTLSAIRSCWQLAQHGTLLGWPATVRDPAQAESLVAKASGVGLPLDRNGLTILSTSITMFIFGWDPVALIFWLAAG